MLKNKCCVQNSTGKRTVFGLLRDGWNSMFRYFLNNFYDGYRQVTCIFSFSSIATHLCNSELCNQCKKPRIRFVKQASICGVGLGP